MNWNQVPAAPDAGGRVPMVLPWLLAVIPLNGVLTNFGLGGGSFLAVAVVLGLTALALRVWPAGLPLHVIAATVALSVATDPQLGWHLTIVAVVPLGFWMIATGSSDTPYRWLPTGRLFRPCLLPVTVAAGAMMLQDQLWVAQRLVAVACGIAILIVVVPEPADRALSVVEVWLEPLTGRLSALQSALAKFGRQMGKAAGMVVMLPASVVLMMAWAWQRLVGFDPLTGPAPGTRSWVQRTGGDPEPHRLFSGASMLTPQGDGSWRRSLAAALTAVTVLGILIAAVPGVRHLAEDLNAAAGEPVPIIEKGCDVSEDPAMDQDPGWPQTFCDTAEYSVNGRFSAVTTYTMADHESLTVNVRDGVRTTLRAPECGCRRVTMWMFGGSAAFGWWQRDDQTIASQLAKLAWAEGIALDIEVRANPGWVLGQEQRLFAQLSVTEEEMPDLALFYDGGNELQRQRFRNEEGRGADESPTSYAEDEIGLLLREGPFPWYAGEQLDRPGDEPDNRLPWSQVARHAMNRYLRDLELARRSTHAAGVQPVFAWQPLLVTAGRQAGNPGALTDEEWNFLGEMLTEARAMLPGDVLDLSDVLDHVDHPVFKDLFHHNVEASAIIADALLEELRPRLNEIANG